MGKDGKLPKQVVERNQKIDDAIAAAKVEVPKLLVGAHFHTEGHARSVGTTAQPGAQGLGE